jgi:ribonuclease Z
MTTEVILTGTGTPGPIPGRAGAGTLVRAGQVAVQFDAGRATVLRLAEAGTHPGRLDALFLTHVHSDHVQDVPDVTMTRWIYNKHGEDAGPLPIVAPQGPAARFVRRMLAPFDDDIAARMAHVDATPPRFDLTAFPVKPEPQRVWQSTDGTVTVDAVQVHHEPVTAAVAYRVAAPDGVVVISGDTIVCDEVAQICSGADVLVHEACRATALASQVAGTPFETIFSYHADTVALGALAEKAGVRHLVLTHLIPPPADAASAALFEADVRHGGYHGQVTVGQDLTRIAVGAT